MGFKLDRQRSDLTLKVDVVIVGAGPAGSTAAYYLANKFNRKVFLIDKAFFPRDKPCGGYLTSRVFTRFNYLRKVKNKIIEVPTYGSYFYGPDLSQLEWRMENPVGYLVLRIKFDNFLKDLAVSRGVQFIEGQEVVDISIRKNTAQIMLANGHSIHGNLIIGADGVRSIIAKKSGIYSKLDKGICVVTEIKINKEEIDEIFGEKRPTYYFYGFKDIIGYGWLFPKKNHLNIGIGGPSNAGREIGRLFPIFINYLKQENLVPVSIKIKEKFSAALIPTSTALYLNHSYSDRVLLVGDALGVASSVSGEGIYQSMASGEDAAIIANQALDEQKFDTEFLRQYEKLWKKDLANELKMVGNIMQLGSSGDKREILRKIKYFFERMRNEKELFEYFARIFFGFK